MAKDPELANIIIETAMKYIAKVTANESYPSQAWRDRIYKIVAEKFGKSPETISREKDQKVPAGKSFQGMA
jgi:hypothetical protein